MLTPVLNVWDSGSPIDFPKVVVLKGRGMFVDAGGAEEQVGPGCMLLFDPGENHAIQALDDDLVFVGFLRGAPGNLGDRVGGEMGRQAS